MKLNLKLLPRRKPSWWQLALLIGLVMLVSSYGWYRWQLLPAAPAGQAMAFGISQGEQPESIAQRLEQARLIRSSSVFLLYATLHGYRGRLQAGYYELRPGDSASNIAKVIASGQVKSQALVVPEGYRLTQIRQRALEAGLTAHDWDAALARQYDAPSLAQRPPGSSLEGYLFPDTYQVSVATTGEELVRTMLANFERRVSSQLREGLRTRGLSLHQGITLASMVEREARLAADRPKIAQVFLKRLRLGMKLDSDVTVQYAADLEPGQQRRTAEQIKALESPYNTYKVAGLPPGPIASPGLEAIEAVIHPAATDYLYFLADKDGHTHFARTFEEHQRNIQKYLR